MILDLHVITLHNLQKRDNDRIFYNCFGFPSHAIMAERDNDSDDCIIIQIVNQLIYVNP